MLDGLLAWAFEDQPTDGTRKVVATALSSCKDRRNSIVSNSIPDHANDGSLNLRDENGWVAKLDKIEPYRGSVELKDSYVVVNRNAVQGRVDVPCTLGATANARQVWGGVKDSLTPGLAPTNGDYEVVELNRADDGYLIRNTKTGQARSINAGSDWIPELVSADGKIVSVSDSDSGDLYEVHLDTADGELTYYLID